MLFVVVVVVVVVVFHTHSFQCQMLLQILQIYTYQESKVVIINFWLSKKLQAFLYISYVEHKPCSNYDSFKCYDVSLSHPVFKHPPPSLVHRLSQSILRINYSLCCLRNCIIIVMIIIHLTGVYTSMTQ